MAIPSNYSGKHIDIKIDSKLLTDDKFLEEAANFALERTAEAIKLDVTQARSDVFADSKGKWSFPKGGYSNAAAYYTSGKVPYWRGGLIGSFDLIGSESRLSYSMAFTAPYASLIEQGGVNSENPPQQWFDDKQVKKREIRKVKKHPYMESVSYKIEENLENFGYLDVFAISFQNFVR